MSLCRLLPLLVLGLWLVTGPAWSEDNEADDQQIRVSASQAWPIIGQWQVLMMPDDRGGQYCGIWSHTISVSDGVFVAVFADSIYDQHFYVTFINAQPGSAKDITLLADGKKITDLPVLQRSQPNAAVTVIMANLAHDLVVRTIGPALSGAHNLTIATGGQHDYIIPITHFSKLLGERAACVRLMRKPGG